MVLQLSIGKPNITETIGWFCFGALITWSADKLIEASIQKYYRKIDIAENTFRENYEKYRSNSTQTD